MSVFDRRPPVKRYEHGSRVPGWDDAVDLTKPPATVPDPALTPVPEELRSAIEAAMAQYPDSKSASIPALHLAQEHHGWCSPEAIAQVACVMRLTPAYLTSVASFYDMFSLQPKPANDVYVCTNITCSLLGADEFYAEMIRAAEGHDSIGVRGFECLGACDIAPMASVNGEYVGPLNLDDASLIVEDLEAGRPVLEHKQLRIRACADPGARPESTESTCLFDRIDEPGLNTLAVYEQRGGYSALRKALADAAGSDRRGDLAVGHARSRRRRLQDGPEGVVPAQGRHGQVPGLQRRRVRAGHVQGPRADAEVPAHAARGDHHHHLRDRDPPRLHLHPRRVRAAGRHPRGGDRGGRGGRLHRRGHPRLRSLAEAGPAARRRRLHLRRGDGPARLARGQARQPAPEAAVPGDRGPLRRPDAGQQRRDARHRADDHQHGRRRVRQARHRGLDRHQAGLGLRRRAAPR